MSRNVNQLRTRNGTRLTVKKLMNFIEATKEQKRRRFDSTHPYDSA